MPLFVDDQGNRYFSGIRRIWPGGGPSPTPNQMRHLWLLSSDGQLIDHLPWALWMVLVAGLVILTIVAATAISVLAGAQVDASTMSAGFRTALACQFLLPYVGRVGGRQVELGTPLSLPLHQQRPISWTEYAASYLPGLTFGLVIVADTVNRAAAGTEVSLFSMNIGLAVGVFVIFITIIPALWHLAHYTMHRHSGVP